MSWQPQTLGQFVLERAQTRGDAEALVTPSARFTYREQHSSVRRAAGDAGARHPKGDHVGILMGNDEHWLSLFYGAALIGAVTVPVNTRFKAAEIAFCLKQADCKLLFYAERFLNIDFMASCVRPSLPSTARSPARPAVLRQCRGRQDIPQRAQLDDFLALATISDAALDALAAEVRRRPPADPVHVRHHRLSEGRDAHARQHAAQCLGGRARASACAPTTATSTAGRSSTSPARRCRC